MTSTATPPRPNAGPRKLRTVRLADGRTVTVYALPKPKTARKETRRRGRAQ